MVAPEAILEGEANAWPRLVALGTRVAVVMVIPLQGAILLHEANAWPRLVAPRARHAVEMVSPLVMVLHQALPRSNFAAPCARSLVVVAALGVHAVL
jgi:hypothetical protein